MRNSTPIFFRLDDIGQDDENCLEIMSTLESFGSNYCIAVIPSLISKEIVCFIKKSSFARIFQHGYEHRNHVSRGYPDEFPDSLGFEYILKRLKEGRAHLEDQLEIKIEGYVPPWNRTSDTALTALEQLGFKTLSAHSRFELPTKLSRFDVAVDFASSYEPICLKSSEEILQEISKQRISKTHCGLMIHVNNLKYQQLSALKETMSTVARLYPITATIP